MIKKVLSLQILCVFSVFNAFCNDVQSFDALIEEFLKAKRFCLVYLVVICTRRRIHTNTLY